MLLFLGFCAVILVMGISDIISEREKEKTVGVTTTQTDDDDRDSGA
jgi:hypothetical protein